MKQSLLERIRKSDDASLGSALVRMAQEAVAVHQYEAATTPHFPPAADRDLSSAVAASRLVSSVDDSGDDLTEVSR